MKELFINYSMSDIVVFSIIIVLAVKEGVSLIDWFKARWQKSYSAFYAKQEKKEKIEKDIKSLNKLYGEKKIVDDTFVKINNTFELIQEQINMLIESDKEDIKAYITEKHHNFVYVQGWVDDYSLECLEKRFSIYEKEHGNSFVKGLMDEIRSLPKMPPQEVEHQYASTAEYIRKANK